MYPPSKNREKSFFPRGGEEVVITYNTGIQGQLSKFQKCCELVNNMLVVWNCHGSSQQMLPIVKHLPSNHRLAMDGLWNISIKPLCLLNKYKYSKRPPLVPILTNTTFRYNVADVILNFPLVQFSNSALKIM